ncbi:hypothetical protein [Streptomyces anthocyanicus]|uniref:hypothetical protein n=1 Tax=Streptomyces anthocyanicus TaxID=68174 RepID=UPI003814624D
MSLDHPAALSPPVSDGWEILADGLLTHRLLLHQADMQAALRRTPGECLLPEEATPAKLLARPAPVRTTALPLVDAAGLRYWTALPQQYGGDGISPLAAVGQRLAGFLTAECADPVTDAISAVCGAAVWWTGAFAAIRYSGGHPRTFDDVTTSVSLTALERTVHLVALGRATRVLRRHLQQAGDADETLRAAFCRAVTAAIVAEPGIPSLVEGLGELRLTDLVVNTTPWRGQHTAYRSGLGSGQVE